MISFAYITYRDEPWWGWYIASLAKQCAEIGLTEYEVIFVDGKIDKDGRRSYLMEQIGNKFSFLHVSPKPCIWSGPHRLTGKDYFALANARNTAFCYASGDRIIFSDDVSVLGKDYVKYHLEAHEKNIIMAGIQRKVKKLLVISGEVESFSESNTDSREVVLNNVGAYNELQKALDNAWLYGNNFSIPIEAALAVNGVDEIYDGQYGGEDCDFGIRLGNAGYDIYIDPRCVLVESEEAHCGTVKYDRIAKCLNGRHANETPCFDARDNKRILPIGNKFNLRDLRESILSGGKFPIPTEPTIDWRDGEPLNQMNGN